MLYVVAAVLALIGYFAWIPVFPVTGLGIPAYNKVLEQLQEFLIRAALFVTAFKIVVDETAYRIRQWMRRDDKQRR